MRSMIFSLDHGISQPRSRLLREKLLKRLVVGEWPVSFHNPFPLYLSQSMTSNHVCLSDRNDLIYDFFFSFKKYQKTYKKIAKKRLRHCYSHRAWRGESGARAVADCPIGAGTRPWGIHYLINYSDRVDSFLSSCFHLSSHRRASGCFN